MINKNRKQVELEVEYRDLGNWNYKNNSLPVNTKPIAVIKIDGDEFVFSHEDIFKILEAYLDVDERSMNMIRQKIAGEIRGIDTAFIDKIKNFVKEHSNDLIKVEKQSKFNW